MKRTVDPSTYAETSPAAVDESKIYRPKGTINQDARASLCSSQSAAEVP